MEKLARTYVMKQEVFSLGQDFEVEHEGGGRAFFVDGKVTLVGDKLVMQDADGAEVAVIQRKVLAVRPTFQIFRQGDLYATVTKRLLSFKDRFDIDIPGPRDLEVEGSFTEHEFVFRQRGRGEVARVSKEWFSWSDSYGITVAGDADDALVVACTVVIDLALDAGDRN